MSDVVGMIGAAGTGKSVAALKLAHLGYRRVRFSAPLKDMLRAFYNACGLERHEIERRIEGDLKGVSDPLLGGKTPRYAMQTLGTEWGRTVISPTIWSDAWRTRAEKELSQGHKVVAEDVRFETEVVEVRALGGVIAKVTGRNVDVGTHASEQSDQLEFDFELKNDTTIPAFEGRIEYIFRPQSEDDAA